MTKCLTVDPSQVRQPGGISFEDIPVNVYQKTVADEKKNFTKDEFLRMYRDMLIIREFETMLNLIKTTGEYEGEAYNHPGPAHLGIGQEAAYVGQAYGLSINDYTFGSHRSHGEILAKGLSAITQLGDDELMGIMKDFFGGETFAVVEKTTKATNVKDIAIEFLLYGTLAEIFARKTGFNRGLGGSMHAFFIPFGIFPNNAIVGGSADIAAGAALYKRVNNKDGIVVCNIGDGSIGCGPVYEAMNFAAMDQFNTLWDDDHRGGLPIIFNIFNNFYGMGGQTCGETMAYSQVARLGAGVTPSQMYAERVDGYNPLAVIDAYKRKRELIESRKGPVLLDVLTYRISGHSPSDASAYRAKEEVEAWQQADSIAVFGKQIKDANIAKASELEAIEQRVKAWILSTVKLAKDDTLSPRMDLSLNPNAIADLMFSNGHVKSMDDTRKPEALETKEENAHVKQLTKKVRFSFDEDGKPVSKNKVYQLRDGIFEAIIDKYYEDPTLTAYGEDVREWGGAFAVYRGLSDSLPYHRLFNSPISEAAIVGTAVGYAMAGGRVIAELMYADFLGRAGDEVFNQLSKWQSMSAGILKMPCVLRMSVGSKYGAQHSQDWSALCTHIPGLKVVFPATPYDAKGLMAAALNGTDPVIFLESQRVYDIAEQFHEGGVPAESYEIEIGEPDVKVQGSDLTILSVGATLYRVMDAVKLFAAHGISVEVIDARSLVPFNYEKVIESVKKTGRIIITGDACERGSHLNDFARNLTELAFDYLDAPPVVVGAKNWITPAHELEDYFFPQPFWYVDAFHERISPIPGHTPQHNFTELEQINSNKRGV